MDAEVAAEGGVGAEVAPPPAGGSRSGLEALDPSLAEGHRIFYEREVPFEIRAGGEALEDEGPAVGALEAVRVKILILGERQRGRATWRDGAGWGGGIPVPHAT